MSSTHDSTPDAAARDTDALFDEVQEGLRRMAHRGLGRVGAEGTVNTAELIHDLYVRLSHGDELAFADPAQFFSYAARAMRHILVDRARQRLRLK